MNIFFLEKRRVFRMLKKFLTYPAKENIHYNEYE